MKISEYIHPIEQFGKAGSVHTVFPYSFNLQIGEQLINVSSYFEYLASYGLYLPKVTFEAVAPYVRRGDFVKVNDQEFVFYSQNGIYHLPLIGVETRSLDVRQLSLRSDELLLLQKVLENQNLEEKLGLSLDRRTQEIFAMMRKAKPNWAEIVAYLVGRGGGGTPSGDDILVAYLSLLYATGQSQAITLSQALLSGKLATPDVSKAYLIAATDGFVNSLVYQLFLNLNKLDERLTEKNVQQLMAIGHSSGKDLSYGLLLGTQLLNGLNE